MASDDGDSDDDDEFLKDLEALKRACVLTGTDSDTMVPAGCLENDDNGEDNGDEDLNLIRDLQKRFAMTADDYTDLEPLCTILPGDDLEDDFETLRAIQRRFAAYGADGEYDNPEQGDTVNLAANNLVKSSNVEEDQGYVGLETANDHTMSSNAEKVHGYVGLETAIVKSTSAEEEDAAGLPVKGSSFPKAAEAFVDAITKNRSCQKLIRSKLMHVESRMEELKELKERVKILKDFQVACARRTGRALSQKKDARTQLISMSKTNASSKLNEKRVSPMLYGPIENPQVSKFRELVEKSPALMGRANWSKEEKEQLSNGLKQQFQEMLLQRSLDLISDGEGYVDGIVESISDVDITPDKLRQFLPKVNWDYLASLYVPGRSGVECQTRWLNCEDPLINKNPWTSMEDKTILHGIQKGLRNWIDIAMSLGTNRTPFQCLARYQRSLNASILKREWTEEEDNQLRAAVEAFGESNWQIVASAMEGRTGPQCSNRWLKTLHPARQRIGRWAVDEDKRLKVAATLFGPKNWKKIAKFVPGRMQVQCRERWVNSVDPSLNLNTWTEEEDSKLKEAIEQHGYCWSKIAACVPPRTDNQCRRRWKVLLPDQVPLLRAAREMQKVALISNFVDRESERPALHPNDFVPSRELICIPEPESTNPPKKQRRGLRRRRGDAKANSSSGDLHSEEVSGFSSGTEGGAFTSNVATKKKRRKRNSKNAKSCGQDGGSDLVESNLMACSDVNTVVNATSDETAKEPVCEQEGGSDWVESNLFSFNDVNTSWLPGIEEVLEMNIDEESAKQVPGLFMSNSSTYGQGDEDKAFDMMEQPHSSHTYTSLLMEELGQLDTNFGEVYKADTDFGTETLVSELHPSGSGPRKTGDGDDVTVPEGKREARSSVRGCRTKMRSLKSDQIVDDDSTLAAFCKKRSGNVDDVACLSQKRSAAAETWDDDAPLAALCKKREFTAADIEDDDATLASFCSKLKRKKNKQSCLMRRGGKLVIHSGVK